MQKQLSEKYSMHFNLSLTSNMLSWFSTVALLLISSELTFALEVRSCSSKKPLPLSVDVDGCHKEPCKVVNKKKFHFAINFEVRKLILHSICLLHFHCKFIFLFIA